MQSQDLHSFKPLHKVFWIFEVHQFGQVLNLDGILRILKQDHAVCVQTDTPLESALVKHILDHCNDRYIFMMTLFGKEVSCSTLQVVHCVI